MIGIDSHKLKSSTPTKVHNQPLTQTGNNLETQTENNLPTPQNMFKGHQTFYPTTNALMHGIYHSQQILSHCCQS